MDALDNLTIVENARDLKAVRHLYDEVEANVRALSSVYYCHQCSKAQGNFKEEWSLFHLYQEKSPQ